MIIAHGETNRILLADFLGIPDDYFLESRKIT
jgi:broad specificity phosphatase PhoE